MVFILICCVYDLTALFDFEHRLHGLGASVRFCQKSQRFWKLGLNIMFYVYSFEKMVDCFKKCVLAIEKNVKHFGTRNCPKIDKLSDL